MKNYPSTKMKIQCTNFCIVLMNEQFKNLWFIDLILIVTFIWSLH